MRTMYEPAGKVRVVGAGAVRSCRSCRSCPSPPAGERLALRLVVSARLALPALSPDPSAPPVPGRSPACPAACRGERLALRASASVVVAGRGGVFLPGTVTVNGDVA